MIVAGLFLLVGHLVLTYTRFGRYVYMVGGNREAAEYSGVNVRLVIASVMIISAVCSGVAGMIGVAYFGSAQQNEFDSYLLDAISAVVVGGTSLFGGRGGIGNTIVGLLGIGRAQQWPGSYQYRQFPEDPDPWSDPAGGVGHQHLCATPARYPDELIAGIILIFWITSSGEGFASGIVNHHLRKIPSHEADGKRRI